MIVVIGGAGQVGSAAVAALCRAGHPDIVVCDQFDDAPGGDGAGGDAPGGDGAEKWRNLRTAELAAVIRPADLFPFLDGAKAEVQTVITMAGAAVDAGADGHLDASMRLTLMLWDWATRTGTRMLYASSWETYGIAPDSLTDGETASDLAPLQPHGLRGWVHHQTDRRVARLSDDSQLRRARNRPPQWAGLKLFPVYGPNGGHQGRANPVHAALSAARAGQDADTAARAAWPAPDPDRPLDFLWVEDAAAVVAFLQAHDRVSGLFNVASGMAWTASEVAATARAVVQGTAPPAEPPEKRDATPPLAKLRRAGFQAPMTRLAEGMQRLLQLEPIGGHVYL